MSISVLVLLDDALSHVDLPKCPDYFKIVHAYLSSFKAAAKPYELLSTLWQLNHITSMFTIGADASIFPITLGHLPFQVSRRWWHLDTIGEFNANIVVSIMLNGDVKRENEKPLISVFMSTFKSGDKLNRPWESLQRQTYRNWELIVCDDSPNDDTETYELLKQMSLRDLRVKVFRTAHNGFIGDVKRTVASLASGEWIVELDHDDRTSWELFDIIADIHKRYPKCGFIYSDFVMVNTDMEHSHIFKQASMGYGCYFKQLVRNKVHNVYQAQSLNPVTATHIVGVPNHVRIWRTDVYMRVGRHRPHLGVADDYDLIMRTFLDDCEWVRIPDVHYVQYNNEGGNNFTYIRNQMIQHLSPELWRIVYSVRANAKFKKLGFGEWNADHTPCWLRPKVDFPRYEHTYYAAGRVWSMVMVVKIEDSADDIRKTLLSMLELEDRPEIFAVGHPQSRLHDVIMALYDELRALTLEQYYDPKCAALIKVPSVKWWDFKSADQRELIEETLFAKVDAPYTHHLKNYALKIGVRTEHVAHVNVGDTLPKQWLSYAQYRLDTQPNGVAILDDVLIHDESMIQESGVYWLAEDTVDSVHKRYAALLGDAE